MDRLDEMVLLYAVTDSRWAEGKSLRMQVEQALRGGVTCVQLREKCMSREAFLKEAVEINELCQGYGVPLIINDDVEIALECNAAGVHVGQKDLKASRARELLGEDKILGVSAHSVEEALAAVRDGADYLGAGAAFGSRTKTDANALSRDTLKAICEAVPVPVVAIGGIGRDNLVKLKGTGISGAALVSTIFGAENIEMECRVLLSLVKQTVDRRDTK